uniref:LysR family transcriptional regulator n=1 Tax=Thalassolituus sp. TaxID=2030822 RepID=UPI00355966C8
MNRLNYKHLHYFYHVAETGSLHAAADKLAITPQTISGQLKLLEDDLGEPLLRRKGRNVELTDAGQMAYQYCKDIFRLGDRSEERRV